MAYPEAVSEEAFVWQLVQYARSGHWFYRTGLVPDGKDPAVVDAKLLAKYDVPLTKDERYYEKKQGRSTTYYLRHGRLFVILGTRGSHRAFFDEEEEPKDMRNAALHVFGHAIKPTLASSGKYHVLVKVSPDAYKQFSARLLENATRWSGSIIAERFWNAPFGAYRPVIRQLERLLQAVNRRRSRGGLRKVSDTCIRRYVRTTKVFEEADKAA